MAARIVGMGQAWAGDDGVGIAVIARLKQAAVPVDLVEAAEPAQLITLLTDGADPVVLVDAIIDDGPAGRVLLVDAQTPDQNASHLLSTHGLGVMEAIELAHIAHPDRVARRIFIVGITIQSATRGDEGLSGAVEGAVPLAAARALELAASDCGAMSPPK
ncbi:MAG: hydrogenase maturation protease [Candidatus Binataceae bacterium]